MTYCFDLTKEPWIPCILCSGERLELGLEEALVRATEIREVSDPSPLVTVSLHRLLLAILHRVFGPKNAEAWEVLWEGKGDSQYQRGLSDYFAQWRSRFDLFDRANPFYQKGGFSTAKDSPVARLLLELSSGNNQTLFDHSVDDIPSGMGPAEAARSLVCCQNYALGGGKTETIYSSHSPLVQGVTVIVTGESLFETLLLNLICYDPNKGKPIPCTGELDLPAWERDMRAAQPGKRHPFGYLDLLTWQSRWLLLVPEGDPSSPVVRRLRYAQGEALVDDLPFQDPLMPTKAHPERGHIPIRLTEERALWRDSLALLQIMSDSSRPSMACDWISHRVADEVLPITARYRLSLFGVDSDKAKVNLWRREDIPMPVAYLVEQLHANVLSTQLQLCEDVGLYLGRTVRDLARDLLVPDDEGGRSPDKAQVERLFTSFDTMSQYWGGLEKPFYQLVLDLPGSPVKACQAFVAAVGRAAVYALEQTLMGLDGSGRALKASVKARARLRSELKGRGVELWQKEEMNDSLSG